MKNCAYAILGAALCVVLSAESWAFKEEFVVPKVAEIGDFRTVSGATLKDANVSWESYGTLNADKSNVILIVPFFTGSPHAAGKYTAADAQPGYWDNIIGSGMPLDTDKYYVLSVDALCNMNKLPANLTTGPASTNPDTGKPYGSSFPVLTMEDFVRAQKAVVDSLGITKLHAVMGYSMGAAQALQWAVSYPDVVERAILVTPWSMATGWNLGKAHVWSASIRRDPNFNGGDYYDASPPVAGLAAAAEIAIMDATGYGFVNEQFGRAPGQEGADPAVDVNARFAAENWLIDTAKGFASAVDANGWLCQAEAIRHFDPSGAGSVADVAARIESKMLLLPADSDNILPEAGAEQLHEALLAAGKDSTLTLIPGNMGHWNGWFLMPSVGADVASFLAQ